MNRTPLLPALLVASLGGLLAPSSHAQVGTVVPTGGYELNAADCSSSEQFEVQYDVPFTGNRFWSLQLQEPQPGSTACPVFGSNPPLVEVEPWSEQAELAANGQWQHLDRYTAAELLGPLCSTTPRRGNFPLCIYFSETTNTPAGNIDIDEVSLPVNLAVDTAVPTTPVIVSFTEGDGQVTLHPAALDDTDGDVYTWRIQYRSCDDAVDAGSGSDGGAASTVADDESLCDAPGDYRVKQATGTSPVLSGLENSITYEIRLVAVDDFDNVSDPSAAILATPRGEITPLDVYQGQGSFLSAPGPDCESCLDTSSTLGLLGGAFLLKLRRRRRRRPARPPARRGRGAGLLGLLLLGAFLAAAPAAAYPGQLTVGLKLGPYTPAIDTEKVNGDLIYPVYECFFAEDAFFPNGILPNFGFDLDVHLFDMFGSLELGLGGSLTQARGTAAPLGSINASELSSRTCPEEKGTGSVELTIAMVKPQLTYRLDPLLDYYGIPIVPYARLGLVAAGYAWTVNGAFDNDNVNAGRDPIGLRFGAEASVGLMVALDWVDLRILWDLVATGRLRAKKKTSLLEHAYFFGELTTAQINTFGLPGIQLSPQDNIFGTKWPITANFGVAMELF